MSFSVVCHNRQLHVFKMFVKCRMGHIEAHIFLVYPFTESFVERYDKDEIVLGMTVDAGHYSTPTFSIIVT